MTGKNQSRGPSIKSCSPCTQKPWRIYSQIKLVISSLISARITRTYPCKVKVGLQAFLAMKQPDCSVKDQRGIPTSTQTSAQELKKKLIPTKFISQVIAHSKQIATIKFVNVIHFSMKQYSDSQVKGQQTDSLKCSLQQGVIATNYNKITTM